MIDHELVYSYDRHKKEAQRILDKITNRHYQELQRVRSEGFQIVDDLKEDLRKCFRRAATERVSRCIRRKQMTEHFEKLQVEGQQKKRKFFCPRLHRKTMTERMSLVKNQIDFRSRRTSKKNTILEHIELDKLLIEVQASLNNSETEISKQEKGENFRPKNSYDSESAQQKGGEISDDQANEQRLAHYHENKTFLPMLELYVQQRFFLKTMSKQQERTGRIITQMLLLAIARRKNKKLLDSLDILVQIDCFFPKHNHQMEQLKSAWYQLIAAVFLEIKSEDKKEKANRWKTGPQHSSIKKSVEIEKSRQKTIIIRSLASKRNFYDRVSVQLKKMDLIHETTYLREQKDYRNIVQNSQTGRIILSRIDNSCILSYPQPRCLFPDCQSITNYGMVFVRRDKQTNLFPNHYPIALSDIISQEVYISVFCKINSVLVPETKCFTFATTLNFNYEYIFIILLLLFLGVVAISVLIRKYGSILSSYFAIFLIFILILFFCLKMHGGFHSSFGKSNESYHSINKILQNWEDQYDSTIKLTLSDSSDLIIISYPKEVQSESIISEIASEGSSQRIGLPQRLRTLRCSLNQKFLHQIQEIVKTNKSSEQADNLLDQASEIAETNEQHVLDHHFGNSCREEGREGGSPDSVVDESESSDAQAGILSMKTSSFAIQFESSRQKSEREVF